ncbi:MAG: hypothetical protein QW728_02770 [Thermoplasmata archaeon]
MQTLFNKTSLVLSKNNHAVFELPMKLIIIAIIMAITISAVLGGLQIYSINQTRANCEAAVNTIVSNIQTVYSDVGSNLHFPLKIKEAGWGQIDYIRIGNKLDSLQERALIRWSTDGQQNGKEIRSSGGASITTTTAPASKIKELLNDRPYISVSDCSWSQPLELVAGDYEIAVAALSWDSNGDQDGKQEMIDTFILIYDYNAYLASLS